MVYTGTDRRKHPRINARFVVSYRVLEDTEKQHQSQTKNFSLGGMLLTTNRKFEPGTNFALEMRLPFDDRPITIVAKVLESHEVTKDLIYDTRLQFLTVDDRHVETMKQTVDYYVKKG